MEFVDIKAQYRAYKEEIDERMRRVLEHGQFIMGPEVFELEEALAGYVGVKHCITVASGTMSLEIALRALGIGRGDEVITVPFTWISTAEAVSLVGATPVFVDIEADTYNIDVTKIEAVITPRTKAIIPVSLFGQMPDYDVINAICEPRGITVIEDAAQSFGATRNGQKSCSVTRIGSTSFFPAKPLGCFGDGGALFTSDDSLAQVMRDVRIHGGKRHHHTHVGTNGRFDTLQAAVLLAKLPHFETELENRRTIAAAYSGALKDVVTVPVVQAGNRHVYAQYTIRTGRRDELAASLRDAGIPTAIYYPKCVHQQPVYDSLNYQAGSFPVSERCATEVLSLPLHPFLIQADCNKVCAEVSERLA